MTALEAARDFLEHGWVPLPIPYRQKRPIIKNWPALRITRETVAHYFDGEPMNVGVLLGEPSGNLDDIDLDCREAVLLAPAFLPPTDAVFGRESKPRSHWLYVSAIPKRIEYAEHADDGGETLLELRAGVGHQTIFPGSVHACGEPIEWADCGDPAAVDPAQLEAAVGRLAAACLLVRAAPADNRGRYMLEVAGVLVRELGRDGAAEILTPVGRLMFGARHTARGEKRLLDNTVRKLEAGEEVSGWPKLVERIGRRRADKLSEWLGLPSAAHGAGVFEGLGKAKVPPTPEPEPPRPLMRPAEPATPYPVEELGTILSGAALAIHDKIQAPLAICGTSVLAASALAVQGHADVVLPTGQRRPLSLYALTIAESGERKTSVDEEAKAPIEARETVLRHEHDVEMRAFAVAADAWNSERQSVLKKAKSRAAKEQALKDLGPAPVAPMEPMLTAPEPTFEGLCRLLATGHPSVGVFSDEGGEFVGGHAMNADNRLKTAAGMSGLWSTGIVKRLRSGDGAQILSGRRVSFHLMVQPLVANLLLGDSQLADQGILSRLLITAPDALAGQRPWHEPKPESGTDLARYQGHLFAILSRPMPCAVDKRTGARKPNELSPRALPLSPEARALWIQWSDHCDAAMAPGGDLEPIRAFANKLGEQAARIAGVLTLIDKMGATEIDHEHLSRGINLAQHYAAEAARLARAGVCDPDLALAQKLLDWLHTSWPHPLVSLPDIYQRGLNRIDNQNIAARMIVILANHGWVTKVQGGAVVAGVKRQSVWAIVGKVAKP